MKELERVALTKPLPEFGLEPGDVGTIVAVHQEGKGYTVEFMSLQGSTVALVTERADAFRQLKPREITHAREVAFAGE